MNKFSVVSKDLSPVQSLTQLLVDIGVHGMIAIKADDGGYQQVRLDELDHIVMSRTITFCTEKTAALPVAWNVVPLYAAGERFIVKSAKWNPVVGEIDLDVSKAGSYFGDITWTVPRCRYMIDGNNGGLRPRTFAWWVPASRVEPHEA